MRVMNKGSWKKDTFVFRKCAECNTYAVVLVMIDDRDSFLCQECLEAVDDPSFSILICAVQGCSEEPIFFTSIQGDDEGMLYLCPEHFYKMEHTVEAAVPNWLLRKANGAPED